MASKATSRRLQGGQVLFLQDEPAEALYEVQTGRLRLSQATPGGQLVTLGFVGPGEICAALAALDGGGHPFTAGAVAPTVVLRWHRSVLGEIFRDHPPVERNVLGVVGAQAREMLDRFRELATEPAPRRLARALLRLVRLGGDRREGGLVIEPVRQRDLAELTATSPYTVNRVLSTWEASGIVENQRARIIVTAQGQLRRIAAGC